MKYLSIFIRVALLALGQSLDCHSASEVSLMDMEKSCGYFLGCTVSILIPETPLQTKPINSPVIEYNDFRHSSEQSTIGLCTCLMENPQTAYSHCQMTLTCSCIPQNSHLVTYNILKCNIKAILCYIPLFAKLCFCWSIGVNCPLVQVMVWLGR